MTVKPTREQRLEACLNFFASVIKSGEPWTSICETEYGLATEPEPADHTRCHEVLDALNREIAWLRDVHRHTIDQLVARYELVPPNFDALAKGGPPLRPDQPIPSTSMTAIKTERLEQLLAIEKAAKAIVDTETRHAVLNSAKGTMAGMTCVSNSQFWVLADAVTQEPKDPA